MSINILIVDDEASMERLIKRVFREEHKKGEYNLTYFNSADGAYSHIFEGNAVDIVLLDINMPGQLDGLALLSELHTSYPLIKVIMISAYGDMARSRKAMQNGAFDFLEKPIDSEELRFIVKRASVNVIETSKVSSILNEIGSLNSIINNEMIDVIKNESMNSSLEELKSEESTILVIECWNLVQFDTEEEPQILVQDINSYFTGITKCIYMYNGYIDKFINNSIIAVFTGPRHNANAMNSVSKIADFTKEKNKVRELKRERPVRLKIGIAAGTVIFASIGSTDPLRLEYSAIGKTVKIASMLKNASDPDECLVLLNKFTEEFSEGATAVSKEGELKGLQLFCLNI